MEFMNTFLSRLFGSNSEKRNEEEKEALQEQPAIQNEEQEQEQAEEDPVQEEASIPLPARKELELSLPYDQALLKLHEIREDETGEAALFYLCLEGVREEEEEKELGRLRRELTKEAELRLAQAVKEKEKKKETEEQEAEEPPEQEEAEWNSLDAQPFVYVSDDRMAAWLMVFPPIGQGKELTKEMLHEELRKKEVTFGIDEELLDRLEEEKQYFCLFFAAKGQEAVHGEDGYIIDHFSRVIERKFKVDEHDRVDYMSLNLVQNAKKGEVICEAVPATKGVPGRTVLNREIPGRDGKEAKFPKGRNTEISEDGTKLLACQAGHVEFASEGFRIKTVFEIDGNVDYTTGNINFLGDVHIKGDVCSGFSVQAVGDITVDGVVESANVEAGGDLTVVKGIVGDRDSVVRAHHDIYVKYIRSSIVHVKGSLHTDSIRHSDVYCDGEVKAISGKGVIIGGKIRAAQGVEAKVVGAQSGIATAIVLGGQPCANFERKILLKEIEELEKESVKLEKQPESPARTTRMNKIRLTLSINKVKLGRFETELEKINEKLEKQGGSRMKCQIAYPGLSLTIGDETKQLDRETSSCNARLVEGEILWA